MSATYASACRIDVTESKCGLADAASSYSPRVAHECDMALALLCGYCSSIRQGVMTESRGFVGRRGGANVKLPPGQYLTTDFPILSAGPTPHVPLDKWELTIDDGTNALRRWNWTSFREFETDSISADLHCVTR